MSWADDLQRLADKGGRDLGDVARELKISLFSSIVLLTRVDLGRLKGNWQIQENRKAQGVIDRLDKTGEKVITEIEEKATAEGLTFFTNNLPYAKTYENIDGMVGRNVVRVREILREEVAKK